MYEGYFADPFVLRRGDRYYAYGTGVPSPGDVFDSLSSPDLTSWTPEGRCLRRLDDAAGDEYWAPEVAYSDGAYWMYYSVGRGISGHHIRVARSDEPTGPFEDQGVNLTPHEMFAIDPHPFQDVDGTWYLYYARDVLTDPRPGTQLAVDRFGGMTALMGNPAVVLAPNADWQIYARNRAMYGDVYEWHTMEGPTVVRRHGRYWLTYSGGSWEGHGYGVSWGVAPHPLGPWEHAPTNAPRLLETTPELVGPGHSSITTAPGGRDVLVFHAWDNAMTGRRMHLRYIEFTPDRPAVGGPL
ncbi:MAG: glycoside hydrolase [Cryobacterium sp.]|nr:glycoside hydrolase [Cryobacterium sp.]